MFGKAPEGSVFPRLVLSDIEGAGGGKDSEQQDERAIWGGGVWAEKQGESCFKV